jgi:hypothetical protein
MAPEALRATGMSRSREGASSRLARWGKRRREIDRQRPDRDTGFRRCPHALRRSGRVGQPAHTVVLAHLIVAHEVTNVGIDKGHLGSMVGKARKALGAETIKALADKGYFKSEEMVACEEAGIEVYFRDR